MQAGDSSTWQPLRLLTFYRLILVGLLGVLHLALHDSDPFNIVAPQRFNSTLLSYLVFSIAIGFATRLRWPNYQVQALLQILVDIVAIALLMHATGGVVSSLTVLLVVAVTVGALLLPGRLAYLFAAVATLAVLFESGLESLSLENTDADNITRAGLLGVVFFAAAGLAQMLAMRVRESEALAQQRGIDLANLQQLNQYLIQQLQSGVLVVDADNNIHLANNTARTLLGLESRSRLRLDAVSPDLARQLDKWQHNDDWQPSPVQSSLASGTLIPRFSKLETAQGNGALILLEDSAQLARQTQQIKLASLGRLTASIAHEIRNPLGAISHAAQLLGESEGVENGDKRLTEIIRNHTQRVNTIIENVLQLSRRDTSQLQTLVLDDWLQGFHDEFVQTENIDPGCLQLELEPADIAVSVDPGHLHQILTNLCQNAFRHTGSDARVVIRGQNVEGGDVRLDIIDNGSGIDVETVEQMFEPFYTTASSGTGLGLYIARELCEINQARLSYQPQPQGGSCFTIHLASGQSA
jgi:two-component system sensor histidine kinase PilS (NtrC family)